MFRNSNTTARARRMVAARVQKGIEWLDAQAEKDSRFAHWRIKMIFLHNPPRLVSKVKLAYDNQNPLSLAVGQSPLEGAWGSEIIWAEAKKIYTEIASREPTPTLVEMGFEQEYMGSFGFGECGLLNQVWEQALLFPKNFAVAAA